MNQINPSSTSRRPSQIAVASCAVVFGEPLSTEAQHLFDQCQYAHIAGWNAIYVMGPEDVLEKLGMYPPKIGDLVPAPVRLPLEIVGNSAKQVQ